MSKYSNCWQQVGLVILSLLGSAASLAEDRHLEKIPDVPERYWFLYEPNWPFAKSDQELARHGLPFEKVSLERRGGLGPPNYTVTLFRDGRANFDGGANAPRIGKFQGAIELNEYGRLCFLLERLKFKALPEDIRARKDHGSHGFATVISVYKSEKDEPIQNWEISGSGPIELWGIQMAMDGISSGIRWKPDDAKGKPQR